MDVWQLCAGMFTILMIEEGDWIRDMVKSDEYFRILFSFISVLSFVLSVPFTVLIFVVYHMVKLVCEPYREKNEKV